MPDSTVQQVGGDFSTLASALADAGTGAGDTITIQGAWTIDDTVAAIVADDNITIIISQSNPSYHNGIYDESANHYRLEVSGASHNITVNNTGCVIDGPAINSASATVSQECFRMAINAGTLTISNCLILSSVDANDKDGVYAGNLGCTINIENCMIYGYNRAGLHGQASSVPGPRIQTWNINSCSIYSCARQTTETDGGGINVNLNDADVTYNINVFNSYLLDCSSVSADCFNQVGAAATVNWNIDNCIADDASITARDPGAVGALPNRIIRDVSAGGDEVLVIDIPTTINLLLQDDALNNDAQDAHSNLTGAGLSLPTLDITGATRPTGAGQIDIGADSVIIPSPDSESNILSYGQPIATNRLPNRPGYGREVERVI